MIKAIPVLIMLILAIWLIAGVLLSCSSTKHINVIPKGYNPIKEGGELITRPFGTKKCIDAIL